MPDTLKTLESDDLVEFIFHHGRLPIMTDDKKPWEYRGWLLLYIQLAQNTHPQLANRWGYWKNTVSSGHLLDVPIPQIKFYSEFEPHQKRTMNTIRQWVNTIENNRGFDSAFRLFIQWLGFALGTEDTAPEFSTAVNTNLYRTVNIEPLVVRPCDYFGQVLCEHNAGSCNPTAFYPTPMHVAEAMTEMTLGLGNTMYHHRDERIAKVLDPCMGTGRFLLFASNWSLRLYGQDTDSLLISIAKINGALYAPWLVLPFPESFFPADQTETQGISHPRSHHPFEKVA